MTEQIDSVRASENRCMIALAVCIFFTLIGGAPTAKGSSLGIISENLGNIGMNGQPRMSFELLEHPDAAEIKRLGFAFKLVHQTSLTYGRNAMTDWRISALRTAVYFDEKGGLIWAHPAGREVRFSKTESGFAKGYDGSTAKASPDGNQVDISTTQGATWFFKDGFLVSVQTRQHAYYFKTDRETILAIGKSDAGPPLLEIIFSGTGQLLGFVFADGKKCSLQWTADNCLHRISGNAGPELVFEYDHKLLKNWRLGDGALHELKWTRMETTRHLALGRPPVMLAADSLYKYQWSRKDSVEVLNVSRKSGGFVSQTRFSVRGIIQQTPHEILCHDYKKQDQ